MDLSEVLSSIDEVALPGEGIDKVSVHKLASEKVGKKFEDYCRQAAPALMKIEGCPTMSDPNGAGQTVQPWPSTGLFEPAVMAFVMHMHKNGRGYCGNERKSAAAMLTLEGRLVKSLRLVRTMGECMYLGLLEA